MFPGFDFLGASRVRSIHLTFETVSWTANAGRAAENRELWGRFGESGNGANTDARVAGCLKEPQNRLGSAGPKMSKV